MPKTYRKLPIEVTAMLFDGNNKDDVITFIDAAGQQCQSHLLDEIDDDDLYIETLEGIMHVSPGDYVIRGVANEFYPCKPDIFKDTYELVE